MSNLYGLGAVAIGKSNALYPLDVAGDINFTGALRSNGVIYAPASSQFATVSGSNIALLGGSNLAIGKSNASYSIDVSGDVNVTGNFKINGSNIALSTASVVSACYNWRSANQSTVGIVTPTTITHNPNAALASNGRFTAPLAGSYQCACDAIQVYSSGYIWVDLIKVSNAVTSTLDSMLVYNPNPGSFSTIVSLLANDIVYFAIRAGSTTQINGQTGTISFSSVNISSSGGAASSCYALWYSSSNVPSGNYVGTTAYGGTAVQNSSSTGTNPLSTASGIFTCQSAGVYQCNFTTSTFVPQDTVQIWRNGAIIAPGYQCYGNVNNSISVSASIFCSVGDTLGFYVSAGTIQGASSGTQGCSITLVGGSAGSGGSSQFTTIGGSNVALLGGSNLAIGKSNAAYALDVVGDVNFSGSLRSNGALYVGSQFSTIGGSNIALLGGSNMAIGKSNAAYALDVVGEINASSNIRIAGQSLQGLGVPNQVVLTSSAAWTVPSGVTQAKIQLCGGGGGGGGGGSTGTFYTGGAGGGGGYCEFVANFSSISTLNITIGAGGNGGAAGTSNGTNGANGESTIVTATNLNIAAGGGTFGYGCGQSAYRNANISGNGGSITLSTTTAVVNNSIITVSGSPGQQYRSDSQHESSGPNGGTSFFGGSGGGGINTYENNSAFIGHAPSDAYGGGGGGGRYINNQGGNGCKGVVIITYFTQSGLPNNYTATTPLSMSGTTLSIANATTSAPGVVQVGSGLSVSAGVISINTGAGMAITNGAIVSRLVNILQTVYTTVSDHTPGTTWTDSPIPSITITPASASSRFYIRSSVTMSISSITTVSFRFVRNNTAIGIGTGGIYQGSFRGQTANSSWANSATGEYIDSPATAGSITYKLQFNSYDSARTVRFNNGFGEFGDSSSGISSLTITELSS